jgi:quercetin dioxygenase-like cupin family protein
VRLEDWTAPLPPPAWLAPHPWEAGPSPPTPTARLRGCANNFRKKPEGRYRDLWAGGASLPHRHDAQVFVYVLEGKLTMQLQGRAPVRLRPGQTFYEGPSDIHQASANASQTTPAKILVFMVKGREKPASRDVTGKEAP